MCGYTAPAETYRHDLPLVVLATLEELLELDGALTQRRLHLAVAHRVQVEQHFAIILSLGLQRVYNRLAHGAIAGDRVLGGPRVELGHADLWMQARRAGRELFVRLPREKAVEAQQWRSP